MTTSFQVVTARHANELTFTSVFELEPPPEGHIVILGGVVDEGTLVRIPVRIAMDDRCLRIHAFDATLDLALTKLTSIGSSVAGYAVLSVADHEDGGRFLDGVATALGRAAPKARARERRGPLTKTTVGLSIAVGPEPERVVAFNINGGSLAMRLVVSSASSTNAELAFDGSALDDSWDDFALGWAHAFRDGLEPRRTRAEEGGPADDAPWIVETSPLQGTTGVRLVEARFGAEALFAVAAQGAGLALVRWPLPKSLAPEVLAAIPSSEVQLYPSPDGRWVVFMTSFPDEDGSVTNGTASIHLLDVVAAREPVLLASKDATLRFGDTGGVVKWATDSRRFAFSAETTQLIYDVHVGSFVDSLETDAHVHEWDREALVVFTATYDDEGRATREWGRWVPGAGAPPESIADNDIDHRGVRFAVTHEVVADGIDARLDDGDATRWRYLASRDCGIPELFAPDGRAALFRDDGIWSIGMATMSAPKPTAPLAWNAPRPEGRARACVRAGDAQGYERAAGEVTDPTVRQALAELIATRRSTVAFADGMSATTSSARIDSFGEAARINPTWPAAHRHFVEALRDAGDFARMLEAADAWATLDPIGATMQRSIALQNLGRLDEACVAARAAVALSPDDGDAHYQLACALALNGYADEAMAAANHAASCEPALLCSIGLDSDLTLLHGRPEFARFEAAGLRGRGLQLFEAERLEEARDAFRASVQLEPTEAGFQNWLAMATRLEDEDDGLVASDAWLAHERHLTPFAARCRLLLEAGRNDEALATADAAAGSVAVEGGALATFSRAYARAGRLEDCLRMLEGVIAVRPGVAVNMMESAADFAPVRDQREFTTLLETARAALA